MKRLLCMITLLPFGFFGSCNSRDQQQDNSKAAVTEPQKISASQAKALMDEGKPYTLLDVRTVEEFNGGRIKGAMLIPVDELSSRAEKELPDKNATILVYCRSGARSARAAQILADLGFTAIYDFGGLMGWPYEIVNE